MKISTVLPLVAVLSLMTSACSFANTDTTDVAGDTETEEMMIEDEDPSNDDDDMIENDEDDNAQKTEDAGGNGVTEETSTRIVQIMADNWTFSPSVISAKKGEDVTIQVTGAAGVHGFSIPDLGVNVNVSPGQTVSVTLPTDTVGTFGFRCSIPCGAGHKEMKGVVVVE